MRLSIVTLVALTISGCTIIVYDGATVKQSSKSDRTEQSQQRPR